MRTRKAKRQELPELYGTAELAEALGCTIQNIDRQVGVPEPVMKVKATRLWLADDIKEFVDERDRQRAERDERRRQREAARS
jgi:hypothetical protein